MKVYTSIASWCIPFFMLMYTMGYIFRNKKIHRRWMVLSRFVEYNSSCKRVGSKLEVESVCCSSMTRMGGCSRCGSLLSRNKGG